MRRPAATTSGRSSEDALHLLDALELERVKLLAHDWGGWAGFLLAMHHPERIERFMALNIPPPWVPFNFKVMKATPRMFYQLINASPWVGYKAVQPGSRYMRGDVPARVGAQRHLGRDRDRNVLAHSSASRRGRAPASCSTAPSSAASSSRSPPAAPPARA